MKIKPGNITLAIQGIFPAALTMVMLLLCLSVKAQPGNPTYSLSTNTFFEIDMRSIALLDIETSLASANFSMSIPAPTEAGEGFAAGALATHNSNWINYSCAVRDVTSRSVQVNISFGTLPAGFELRLSTGSASGAGGGTLGTPVAAPIALSGTPQNIINGILGSYTGDGANNGHQLTYTLHYAGSDFSVVETESPQITILYTLIDN